MNVMIFASWGLIYGIFCRLAIAINVHSMAALTSAEQLCGRSRRASQEVLLAVASVLFSVCILLIPVLAKRIVEGDLGGSMLTVLGAATTMAQSLMSAAAGASGGMQGQQPEVAVVPLQVPGAELPPPLQTLLRPVRRRLAVEREAAPIWRFSFAAQARPVQAGARTGRLPASQYSARCGLAWRSCRCHGDARWTKRGSCWPEDARGPASRRRLLQRRPAPPPGPESVDEWV